MKKASQPIYYGKYRIAISLIALCTSLFQTTPTLAQQVTEPEPARERCFIKFDYSLAPAGGYMRSRMDML